MFSKKIVQLREAKGLTQLQLAKLLGKSVTTISNWECGKAVPNLDQIAALAEFFDVSADFFIDRNEYSDPDIRSIQRAMTGMDQKRKGELKTLLSIAFDIDFGEEE